MKHSVRSRLYFRDGDVELDENSSSFDWYKFSRPHRTPAEVDAECEAEMDWHVRGARRCMKEDEEVSRHRHRYTVTKGGSLRFFARISPNVGDIDDQRKTDQYVDFRPEPNGWRWERKIRELPIEL